MNIRNSKNIPLRNLQNIPLIVKLGYGQMLSEVVRSMYISLQYILFTNIILSPYLISHLFCLFSVVISKSGAPDQNARLSRGQREQIPESNSLGDSSTDSLRFINLILFEG